MKRTTLLLTLAVIFTGCGPAEENSGTGGSTGAGPKDTVRKAAEAIKAGDAATLKNLYIHTADGGRVLEAMAAEGKVHVAFCEKMHAAYGKDSVAEIAAASESVRMLTDFDKAELYGGQDGKASVIYPGQPIVALNLREKDGVWRILKPGISDATPDEIDRFNRWRLPLQKGMTSVIDDIGKEGVTKDDILKRMNETVAKERN